MRGRQKGFTSHRKGKHWSREKIKALPLNNTYIPAKETPPQHISSIPVSVSFLPLVKYEAEELGITIKDLTEMAITEFLQRRIP